MATEPIVRMRLTDAQAAKLPDGATLETLEGGAHRIVADLSVVLPRICAEYVAAGFDDAACDHKSEDADGKKVNVCDSYWAEVARRTFTSDLKRMFGTPRLEDERAISLDAIGGLHIRITGGQEWALHNLPASDRGTPEEGSNSFNRYYRALISYRAREATKG